MKKNNSKRILVVAPTLDGYGGMEIETVGFINALNKSNLFKVELFNIVMSEEISALSTVSPKFPFSFIEVITWFKYPRWYKTLIKFKLNFRLACANFIQNQPDATKKYLNRNKDRYDIILINTRPRELQYFLLCYFQKLDIPVVYHEIAKFSSKYQAFYSKLSRNDLILLSAFEKETDFKELDCLAQSSVITQWIYCHEDFFLSKEISATEPITFGIVARIEEEKNIELAIQASNLLREKNLRFSLKVYGSGSLVNSLIKLVESFELDQYVFFESSLPFKKRHKAYEAIDIFLCTSISEGGPITILEAMGSGLPVITTDVGDAKNRIINGYNGQILPTNNDPRDLAKAMTYYINNVESIILHGKNSRKLFLDKFNKQLSEQRFINSIYENTCTS